MRDNRCAMKKYLQTVRWIVFFICASIVGMKPTALAYQPDGMTISRHIRIAEEDNIAKILSVLQSRNSGRKVLDRAVEKLASMDKRKLQLISNLCDRIAMHDGTPGADIAFSLVTAILVLS